MSHKDDHSEVNDIGCMEALEGLYAYLDGELDDPVARTEIEHHLDHCKACYSRIELEGLLAERIRKSAKAHAPDSLQKRMKTILSDL